MTGLADKLRPHLAGEVRDDAFTRKVYSVDASICQIEPRLVVLPRTAADVEATVAIARAEGIPLVPRGAGTGTAGGCIGDGIVIDFTRYMRGILEIDPERGEARCEVGVVQDQLNQAAAPHGLRFGPDTSTGNRATLGGMLGNNSSGAHSMRYGKTVDNVLGAEVLLSTGEWLRAQALEESAFAALAAENGANGRIHGAVERIRGELRDEIEGRFPKLQRRVAGYNLDEMIKPGPLNLTKLLAGSEGTLGIVTELTVQLSPSPACVGLCVVHVADLVEGLRQVPWILESVPFSLELVDHFIIEMGLESPIVKGRLPWLEGRPDGLLIVEFDGESPAEVGSKLERFAAEAQRNRVGYARVLLRTAADIGSVWTLRKAALGLLMARRSHERAIAFLEDVAVPPEHIGDFIHDFRAYTRGIGKEVGMLGHAGVGQIHTRPMMDLHQQHDVQLMLQMMEDICDMAAGYGGTISGEHGDGLIRSWLIERAFGPTLTHAFADVKAAFDPIKLMNPGKIVDPGRPENHLRFGPQTRYLEFKTQFDWSKDGGFPFAVEMCNGNGECRKLDKGPMCPSYQASLDEYQTTRARAVALQAIVRGEVDRPTLAHPELYRILDLCLQCKGCQSECPSQVDMARMKSEVLYHYQEEHGIPFRSRLFGAIDTINRVGTAVAPLANWALGLRLGGFFKKRLGIAAERDLPPFTRERFTRWFASRGSRPTATRGKVALFVDTYTEFNYPAIGQAAVQVLEALGHEVVHAGYSCCGRPMISKGLLPGAKQKARDVVERLLPLAMENIPIVGLEPSCILTIKDEYRTLIPGEATEQVAAQCMTIDEFLAREVKAGAFQLPFRARQRQVWVHAHCYQKADGGSSPTLEVLRAIPGLEVREIDSGCCGMAGSFGYEAEHYEFSLKVGETRLFPAVRKLPADAIVVADGISCRSQIAHGTDRQSEHLVMVVADALTTTNS